MAFFKHRVVITFGLKNHNLALESYIIPSEFNPMFVYKDDSNEFDSDLIRVYEGRVLIKDNDSFEIQKDGDTNYIKDETQFNISKDILKSKIDGKISLATVYNNSKNNYYYYR